MTLEEAKVELPNFDFFRRCVCDECTANDWYCPSDCESLVRAKRIPFEKIQIEFAKFDGELWKVMRYIKDRR